jgi:hypothetical protein
MSRAAERIVAKGAVVYSHAYDRGDGRAGCDRVHQLGAQFAVCTLDDGVVGPFDTLEEALEEADLTFVSEFATEITAPALSAEEVAAMLYSEPDVDGHVFRINGEDWEYRKTGGFRRFDRRTAKSHRRPVPGVSPQRPANTARRSGAAADDVVVVHLRLDDGQRSAFGRLGCGSKKKQDALNKLHKKLVDAIDDAQVGESDGIATFGQGECILLMYGPDADALFDAIKPILKASPHAKGGFAIKRYRGASAAKAREVKVNL